MKGTLRRSPENDVYIQERLKQNRKQISENIMIVDLLRNDLGKIADIGSVHVDSLLDIETYDTIHQMTSTISCKISQHMPILSILSALFPCGSITGAPKKSTCAIIKEKEHSPRDVYTGAIGYIMPNNDMCFSVPIRTMTINRHYKASFFVGGGITYDSHILQEYEECHHKAGFIDDEKPALSSIRKPICE